MPDYQEMYLRLMRETEKTIRILVQAQRDCGTDCPPEERPGDQAAAL